MTDEMIVSSKKRHFSPFCFAVGMMTIAPFVVVIGYDLTLFWLVLLLGAVIGGWALLQSGPDLHWCGVNSSICRWSIRLVVWPMIAFCFYPLYGLAVGLPMNLLRASMSFLVSIFLSMFFFLGLWLRRWPGRHRSFLLGTMTTGLIYLIYLLYSFWAEGLIFSPNLIETRVSLIEQVPTWPSRYPGVLIMLAFIAYSVRAKSTSRLARAVLFLIGLIFIGGVIYSLTRGAWVGLAIALLVFCVYRLRGWQLNMALMALVGAYSIGTDLQQRLTFAYTSFAQSDTVESSTAIRMAIWRKSLEALGRSPLFGHGQQGTGVVLGEVETDLTDLDVVTGAAAHNDYIDMAVRSGVPGLLMYLTLVVAVFLFGWKKASERRDHPSAYLVVGLMGVLGYGFFHELLRFPLIGALFWYLVGSLGYEQAVECGLKAGSCGRLRSMKASAQRLPAKAARECKVELFV